MMSKNDEKREKIATKLAAALLSNPAYMEKTANSAFTEEEMIGGLVVKCYDIAELIINEGKERSNEKSKN